jgi:hypothetical protein
MDVTFVVVPFGIIDAGRQRAVLRRLPSGVEAVDLRTGQTAWETEMNALPLAIQDDQVLARDFETAPDTLAFLLIDATDGRIMRRTESISLPWWVDTRDAGFALAATTEGKIFVVSWSTRRRYRGGAPPSRGLVEACAAEHSAGHAYVDTSGGITVAKDESVASVEPGIRTEGVPIGTMQYQVTAEAVLEARDTASNRIIWQHALGTAIRKAPPLPQ